MKRKTLTVLFLTSILFMGCTKENLNREVTYTLNVKKCGYKMIYKIENFQMQVARDENTYDTTVLRNVGDTLSIYIMSETTPECTNDFNLSIKIDGSTVIDKDYQSCVENRIDDTLTYIVK